MKTTIFSSYLALALATFAALWIRTQVMTHEAHQVANAAQQWTETQQQQQAQNLEAYTDANGDKWTFHTEWKGYAVTIDVKLNGDRTNVVTKRLRAWSTPQVHKDARQFRTNIIAMIDEQNA